TKVEEKLFYSVLNDLKPQLLAFSLVSPNFKLYQRFYPEIKRRGSYKILIGGWQASLNPEETIKYCDYLCVGEGEEVILKLIEKIKIGSMPIDVPNIWFKCSNIIVKQKVEPLNSDLSKYPIPIIDNKCSLYIHNNKIHYEDPYINNVRYGTNIGRGCPYKCTYCSNSYMVNKVYPGQWSKIRYRTVDHVIAELKQAKEKILGLKCINFYDEVFLPQKEWAKEFFKRYKKEINIPFYCMFFPGTCKEE
ncbi:unnamed protein product, partial [marine sediment metagenome]